MQRRKDSSPKRNSSPSEQQLSGLRTHAHSQKQHNIVKASPVSCHEAEPKPAPLISSAQCQALADLDFWKDKL